jgi:nucleoside-diphosphate-sugar epimerase
VKVFVTGATGFVGSAVVRELLDAGHQVLGMARSDAGAKALAEAGAEVHRGDLKDLDSLRDGAGKSEGVVHTAFVHDWSDFLANVETDRRAVEALTAALAESGKPFINTSGTAMTAFASAPGHVGTEDDAPPGSVPRVASEEATVSAAARGVRSAVVRLPPSVHGEGDHGFVPRIIGIARETGVSAYVGDGRNRWPSVHRLDAAHLYRLILEKGSPGARYHAVADRGVPFREIAEVIGRRLNLPVVSKPPEEAAAHFGFLGMFVGMDCPASAEKTQEQLDWRPTRPSLIPDLDQAHYFTA